MSEDKPLNPSLSWIGRMSKVLTGDEPRDMDQIIQILRDAQKRYLLGPDALSMIEGAIQVSEMQVRDIMIPRAQMVVVSRDEPLEEFLPTIIESAHSRFPVIADDKIEVIGVLLAKDLLAYCAKNKDSDFDFHDLIRPPVFVPESKRLNVLLREFKEKRNHIAIVVDEYGAASGLITIEDVIEQIVGDIEDEHDFDDDSMILELNESEFTIKATTPIEDFNEHFNTDFKDDDFDTIGGLIINKIGHLPKRGEFVSIGSMHFDVVSADNRRIHILKLTIVASID
ncbi:MAG: CBS domain-containing protein [Methylococcales bacterium]|jgi:magnesium and cobalt transporter|nr:CBS domain-containing protein [Methylococcales bacterium]MBT7410522.1 CBS domain-containing protein [Methylococcales bacterium]